MKTKHNNPTAIKQAFTTKQLGYINYLCAKGYSTTTTQGYLADVYRFYTWTKAQNIPLETVGHNDILGYIQHIKPTNSQHSVSAIINSLKHYYNYLIASEIIQENPANSIAIKGVKRKKLYTILTRQELEQLYHQCTLTLSPELVHPTQNAKNANWYQTSVLTAKRNQVIVGLLIYQGLNTTELMQLKVVDVKLREGKIWIAGTRKSNERELKLESVQIMDIMEYTLKTRDQLVNQSKTLTDKLFLSSEGGQGLSNALFKLCKKLTTINPKVTSLQQIRTSVITHWLKIHNLRETQYLAGHRYISSTEAYMVNDLEGLQEEIEKYHPIS